MPVVGQEVRDQRAALFGAKQTESIKKVFRRSVRVAATPVSDFMAKLVSAS